MLNRLLSDVERAHWKREHRLRLPCPFDPIEFEKLESWTAELQSWPETPGRWMKYFEAGPSEEGRQLCRVENFVPYHDGFRELLLGPGPMAILESLMGEAACLFKEKINYKLPGGEGFGAHQDAPAFSTFGQRYHVTLLVAVDPQTPENGCLEFADPVEPYETLEQGSRGTLDEALEDRLTWCPLALDAGDVVFFDSYIPHRSGPNRSRDPRRALYVTYNRHSEGDRRADYFSDKRSKFPPDCERESGVDYSEAESLYNLGNPIR
ncbi:MAG: phytanoyl-CoA dioxygenase family protein [Myxococcota bacterium]|nr:phytanoyl-CoA dioxygenase family protein [Myxococcota bacterium]